MWGLFKIDRVLIFSLTEFLRGTRPLEFPIPLLYSLLRNCSKFLLKYNSEELLNILSFIVDYRSKETTFLSVYTPRVSKGSVSIKSQIALSYFTRLHLTGGYMGVLEGKGTRESNGTSGEIQLNNDTETETLHG